MTGNSVLLCGGRKAGFFCLWLILGYFAASVSSCFWPCDVTEHCLGVDVGACSYGTVKDRCECCTICGHGPGHDCGDFDGKCGDGMECVVPEEYVRDLEYPGTCTVKVATSSERVHVTGPLTTAATTSAATSRRTTMASTTQTSTAADISTTSTTGIASTASSPSTPTTPTATDRAVVGCLQESTPPLQQATANVETEKCRSKCSIEHCSDSKHRLCSATGMEFSRVAGRGTCQHTSCRACFLHVESPCNMVCPDPPRKQCFRQYYTCIRRFIFQSNSPLILALEDPEAKKHSGRIICHIPQLGT